MHELMSGQVIGRIWIIDFDIDLIGLDKSRFRTASLHSNASRSGKPIVKMIC